MAWCPKCKSEYVSGIKVCADCGCELVEELETEEKTEAEPEAEAKAVQMKPENYDFPEGMEEITEKEAAAMLQAWQESGMENPATLENLLEDEAAEEWKAASGYQSVYVNNEEKAKEHRASAFTLLLVGCAGLVFVLLFFLGLTPIPVNGTGKYMITGVMGTMFVLFVIMGIFSYKSSRILKRRARRENNLTREIKKWCTNNLTGPEVDSALGIEEQPEELKYFQRVEYVKKMVQDQFLNLDEAYLDRLIDEVYPELFEKSD